MPILAFKRSRLLVSLESPLLLGSQLGVLERAVVEVRTVNQELDERVTRRTKELKESNEQLHPGDSRKKTCRTGAASLS